MGRGSEGANKTEEKLKTEENETGRDIKNGR